MRKQTKSKNSSLTVIVSMALGFGACDGFVCSQERIKAIELANSSSYGLGGAVFSSDEAVALDVADRLDVGMVWINQPEGGGPELPFGGTKRSGVGRELGPLGIDEFVNKKLIHTPPDGE